MASRKFENREFSFIRGSDVQRDGMYLELSETRAGAAHVVAEAFYSDLDASMKIETFETGVPPAAMAWLEQEAARLLPPIPSSDSS